MGVRALHDPEENQSVLYDSVTDTAFGPLIDGDVDYAYEFVDWIQHRYKKDAREAGLDLTGLLLDFEKEKGVKGDD